MILPRPAILLFLCWMVMAGQSTALGQEMSDGILAQKIQSLKNDSLDALLHKLYLHEVSMPLEKSIPHAKHILEIAKRTHNSEAIAKVYSNVGQLYLDHQKLAEAFENFKISYILSQSENVATKAWVVLHIAHFYFNIDLLPEAEKKTIESITWLRQLDKKELLFATTYFLSMIYYRENKFDSALHASKEVISLFKAIKHPGRQDTTEFISAHNTVGLCYFFRGDYDEALNWYKEVVNLSRVLNMKVWEGIASGSRGKLYLKLGYLEKALEETRNELAISKESKEWSDACNSAVSMGKILTLMKRYPEAERYMDSAKNLLPHSKEIRFKFTYYEERAELSRAEGKFKDAFEVLRKLDREKDSVNEQNEIANVKRGAAKQEIEKRDTEIELLQAKNEILALEAGRSNLLGKVLIGSIVTFVFLMAIVYKAYRNKQLSNTQLMAKNEVIEKHEKELVVSLENLKIAQAHLVQSEKMASLGQLTAGIAHEINNPLNFILGGVEAVGDEIQDLKVLAKNPSSQAEDFEASEKNIGALLETVKNGVHRINKIIDSLLFFSAPQPYSHEKVDIHSTLEATLTIMNNKIKEAQIQVMKVYGDVPPVPASPVQLSQVFLNIIDNAVYALKKIEGQRNLIITTTLQEKKLKISFSDNGIGIPDKVVGNIMDPFFTTKEVGKGTGLGLSISLGIIHNHSGSLQVFSKEGKGAEFVIYLPLNGFDEQVFQRPLTPR
ncbi:ATP-binding protein [Chryseolinea soli]|uniref:histidine kinase n=1 Tax=Chryseolinea soli TaxID=2321403 RepID=A0A385SW22_9BACT|nr:ATP-binding protein [Chryseolinea soli]AYB35164.1 GHKL domain-containing protein [Chryseolinea soli]